MSTDAVTDPLHCITNVHVTAAGLHEQRLREATKPVIPGPGGCAGLGPSRLSRRCMPSNDVLLRKGLLWCSSGHACHSKQMALCPFPARAAALAAQLMLQGTVGQLPGLPAIVLHQHGFHRLHPLLRVFRWASDCAENGKGTTLVRCRILVLRTLEVSSFQNVLYAGTCLEVRQRDWNPIWVDPFQCMRGGVQKLRTIF